MGRCCDGRNAYKPISALRYWAGIAIFLCMNLNLRLIMFLRHIFFRRYPHYRQLREFHRIYFHDVMKEIRQRKGLVVKSRCICE